MRKIILSIIFLNSILFSQDVPDWIFQSEDSKYIYGVGSAPKSFGFSQQIRIAKMVARANLSENISVEISSSFEKVVSENGKEINYSTVQKSKSLLKYSSVHKKWTNSDGELFILLAVEKSDLVILP